MQLNDINRLNLLSLLPMNWEEFCPVDRNLMFLKPDITVELEQIIGAMLKHYKVIRLSEIPDDNL